MLGGNFNAKKTTYNYSDINYIPFWKGINKEEVRSYLIPLLIPNKGIWLDTDNNPMLLLRSTKGTISSRPPAVGRRRNRRSRRNSGSASSPIRKSSYPPLPRYPTRLAPYKGAAFFGTPDSQIHV